MPTSRPRRLITIVAAAIIMTALSASPAMAGRGGTHGPCLPGTPLAGETLGGDVSWVARNGGTPLPEHFAFEEGPPPMPPGQLLQFARGNGLC